MHHTSWACPSRLSRSRSAMGGDCEILETNYGFKSMTHEQSIYCGEIKGETVLYATNLMILLLFQIQLKWPIILLSKLTSMSVHLIKGLEQSTMVWIFTKMMTISNSTVNLTLTKSFYLMDGENQILLSPLVMMMSHYPLIAWLNYNSSLVHQNILKISSRLKKRQNLEGLLGKSLSLFIIVHAGNVIQSLSNFSTSLYLDH